MLAALAVLAATPALGTIELLFLIAAAVLTVLHFMRPSRVSIVWPVLAWIAFLVAWLVIPG